MLALVVVGGSVGCGKRGDPLPPLRPVPATAQNVDVRQIGDRIRLAWTAPVRNTDGTTEKLDLREARVLRRVLDLEALVEEQTATPEPTPSDAPPESMSSEAEPASEGDPAAEDVRVEASESPTPGETGPQAQAAPTLQQEGAGEEPEPAAPQRPTLSIPPFAGGVIATLDSEVPGSRVSYEETVEPSWLGKRVEYAVVYVNAKGRRSPLSSVAQIEPRSPLGAPRDVRATTGDGLVRVEWSAPDSSPEELGYAVFRRAESRPELPGRPLAGSPVRETWFEDRAVLFGVPVCYGVKARLLPEPPGEEETEAEPQLMLEAEAALETPQAEEAMTEGSVEEDPADVLVPLVPPIASPPTIESRFSEEVCLTPEDRFPPPAPSDLVAVPAPEGILLTWRVVEVPDLAGYRVYRSERPRGDFALLAEVVAGSYTDEEAEPGLSYYYTVTAIDDAPAINESARTNVVEAVRPPPQ